MASQACLIMYRSQTAVPTLGTNNTQRIGYEEIEQKKYSLLSKHSTARGFSTGLVPVGLTKVKFNKSVLFTEGTPEPEVEIKDHQSILSDS